METIKEMVKEKLQDRKITPEEQLQINKICCLEDDFLKDFTKEQIKKYTQLDLEKSTLDSMENEKAIEIAISITKNIYK